jgi:hypothetical protein
MAKGKNDNRVGLGFRRTGSTHVLAAGETREFDIEIPAEISKTGEAYKFPLEIHNDASVPLAFDVSVNRDHKIQLHIRKPTNGEIKALEDLGGREAPTPQHAAT